MIIGGLQKTTLIDFPGRVACTVFTVGCNFRCPFCHNKDLVTLSNFRKSGLKEISERSFFEFLEKRKKILDGVCITGGEPTINKDLPRFCQKIKDLCLEVKLDTNGSNPEMLKKLIEAKLVDFIAMDVKIAFSDYGKAIRSKYPRPRQSEAEGGQEASIKQSIKLILNSGLEYEFRTTVVPGIHNKENMVQLAKDLKKQLQQLGQLKHLKQFNYVLQQFRPQNCLDPNYLKVKPFSSKERQDVLKLVQKILPDTRLRGGEVNGSQ